jgi:hypothetical protein
MHSERDRAAALNNAEWCAAVWRSHGLPVATAHGLWYCLEATPRYYPNVVTVDLAADPAAQARFIAELRDATPDPDFSVKDSFDRLDLRLCGLATLFEARWLSLAADGPPSSADALTWRRIEDEEALAAWEVAWRGSDQNRQRIFRGELLQDRRVIVLGGFDGAGAVRAGGVAFDGAGVLGLTNIFGSGKGFIGALGSMAPARAMVCYESGEDLRAAEESGFQVLGPLRVWVRAS